MILSIFLAECNRGGVCECDGQFVDNGTGCNVYIASGVDVYCIKVSSIQCHYPA